MGVSLLVLTVLNIILLAGLSFSVFLRIKEKKEDQKLTKGLQLLQSKLSILQDLSDKTDEQVEKLVRLIDTKSNKLKDLVSESQIAQDDIIVCIETLKREKAAIQVLKEELQSTTARAQQTPAQGKHAILIHAAQLAHSGYSLEQIQKETQLSPAEIEMIIKVNKEQLQFASDKLPDWTQHHKPLSNKEIQDFANSILSSPQGSSLNNSQTSSRIEAPQANDSRRETSVSQTEFSAPLENSMPQSFIVDDSSVSVNDSAHRRSNMALHRESTEAPADSTITSGSKNKITKFEFPKI